MQRLSQHTHMLRSTLLRQAGFGTNAPRLLHVSRQPVSEREVVSQGRRLDGLAPRRLGVSMFVSHEVCALLRPRGETLSMQQPPRACEPRGTRGHSGSRGHGARGSQRRSGSQRSARRAGRCTQPPWMPRRRLGAQRCAAPRCCCSARSPRGTCRARRPCMPMSCLGAERETRLQCRGGAVSVRRSAPIHPKGRHLVSYPAGR